MIDQEARNRASQLRPATSRLYEIDKLGGRRLRQPAPLRHRPFELRDVVAKVRALPPSDHFGQAFASHLDIEVGREHAIPRRRWRRRDKPHESRPEPGEHGWIDRYRTATFGQGPLLIPRPALVQRPIEWSWTH